MISTGLQYSPIQTCPCTLTSDAPEADAWNGFLRGIVQFSISVKVAVRFFSQPRRSERRGWNHLGVEIRGNVVAEAIANLTQLPPGLRNPFFSLAYMMYV